MDKTSASKETNRQSFYNALEQRSREIQLLIKVISTTASGKKPKAVLKKLAVELTQALNIPRAGFYMFNEERTRLTVFAEHYQPGKASVLSTDIHLKDNALIENIIDQRIAVMIENTTTDARVAAIRDTLQQRGTRSLIIAPLQFQERLLGTLNLEAAKPKSFTPADISLAKSVADAAGQALEYTRLSNTLPESPAKQVKDSQELKQLFDFTHQVIDSFSQGVGLNEANGKFSHVNPAYSLLLGYNQDELIGKSIQDITRLEDNVIVKQSRSQVMAGENVTYQARLIKKNGTTLTARINAIPLQLDKEVIGSIETISDFSTQTQADQTPADAQSQVLDAEQLKSEFITTMSHEIRTPITAILGMSDLLLKTRLSAEQHEYVNITHGASQSLLQMMDDIIDYSKSVAGELKLEQASLNIADIFDWVNEKYSRETEDKNLSISTHIDQQIPSPLIGDPRRLRQILVNLVGNAVKFTDSGEIQLQASLLSKTSADITVRFNIRDTGIGLSNTGILRLFQPFTQIDGSKTRTYGGTGMGLALCKQLVQLMNGEINVESEEGVGSNFWFSANFRTELPAD